MLSFSKKIINWYQQHKRDLPWRNSRNPYVIWLSEIILQQTRVEQGLPYFYKFIETFADVKQFAEADEHAILKLWQGLGYYSRARNMHHTAKQIVEHYRGKFPASFNELKQLKGVGDYTAAAIASFAFNLPFAVVDGNVYRFLSRHFAIETPIDSSEGKVAFARLAEELLDKKNPAAHNQAIMEIGALICKPKNPLCPECPVNASCIALQKKLIDQLPVKSKKNTVRNRYFYYICITHKNKIVLNKRTTNDIWKNLYDFPMVESQKKSTPIKILNSEKFQTLMQESVYVIKKIAPPVIHKLSHQNLYTTFINIECSKFKVKLSDDLESVPINMLERFPFPTLIVNFLKREKFLK